MSATQLKNIFEWDLNKYTTYVSAMDREHQVLIEIMNELYQANEKNDSKMTLVKLAEKLGQKTKEHFASEEKYLSTLKDYTGLPTHQRIHADLLKRYSGYVESFRQGADSRFAADFFSFLKVWLSAHICGIDRKYGEIARGH